jgi:hypothetical protein
MTKRVLVIDRDDQGHFFLCLEEGAMTIGDSPTHADVVLRNLRLSRIRCEVEVEEDLVACSPEAASTDAPAWSRTIEPGEDLQVGHSQICLELPEADLESEIPSAPAPQPEPAPQPGLLPTDDDIPDLATASTEPASGPAAAAPTERIIRRLLVIDGADQGRYFYLPDTGSVRIGKSAKHADIILHDLYVSRAHCDLEVRGDKVLVCHIEGDSGTLINKQRITAQQEIVPGDVLRVGNSHLRLELGTGETEGKAAAQMVEEGAIEIVDEVEEVVEEGMNWVDAIDRLQELQDSVLGHFRIGRVLGRGHSGMVFRAQDLKSNLVVGLKVLSPDFPATGAELQKFVQALKITPQLHHANLLAIYGAGRTGNHCWITREYIDGESLDQLVERLKGSGKLNWPRACRLAVHLARGLAFLHGLKVVHGNVTPRNILIRADDRLTKLADVRLADALDGSRLQQAIGESKLLGELPYLAPEQTESGAYVDRLADLYAVGAVVYLLLTGQPPFSGKTAQQIVSRIRDASVPRPTKFQRDIPDEFEAIVLKLLSKHQEDRYQTAAELLADVEPIAREHEIKV